MIVQYDMATGQVIEKSTSNDGTLDAASADERPTWDATPGLQTLADTATTRQPAAGRLPLDLLTKPPAVILARQERND